MPLTGKFGLDLRLKYTKSTDLSDTEQNLVRSPAWSIATGVIADAGDLLYGDTRTLVVGTEDIDMVGALTDVFGNAFTPVKLKAIAFDVVSGGTLSFSRHATAGVPIFAAAGDSLAGFAPGDWLAMTHRALAGWPVTLTTADLISFTAVTADVVYNLVLVGTTT